jgi:hypothetical protein
VVEASRGAAVPVKGPGPRPMGTAVAAFVPISAVAPRLSTAAAVIAEAFSRFGA